MRPDIQLMEDQLGVGLQEPLQNLSIFRLFSRQKSYQKHWKKFRRVVISDRWRPYVTVFSHNSRQRCTAHLKRESKDVSFKSKNELAVTLYEKFSEILFFVRIYCTLNHEKTQRIRYANYLSGQIDDVIKRYLDGDDVMVSFGKKLRIAQNNLFTFVIYPSVPSTNNDTEGSIRKCIMQRNVRGQAKSESGMRMLAVFLSCFDTWRIRICYLRWQSTSECLIHTIKSSGIFRLNGRD